MRTCAAVAAMIAATTLLTLAAFEAVDHTHTKTSTISIKGSTQQ